MNSLRHVPNAGSQVKHKNTSKEWAEFRDISCMASHVRPACVRYLVMTVEWGCRCADVHVSLRRGSRGRSGTRSGPYMAALAAFRDAMCAVQSYYGDSRAHGSSEMSPAEALKLARLVANLEQSASKVRLYGKTDAGYLLRLHVYVDAL